MKYADNSALLKIIKRVADRSRSIEEVSSDLEAIANWGMKWKVKFEPKKTHAMLITRKKPVIQMPVMDGKDIAYVSSMKLVGFTIDSKLNWKKKSRDHVIVSSGWWSCQAGRAEGGGSGTRDELGALHSALREQAPSIGPIQLVHSPLIVSWRIGEHLFAEMEGAPIDSGGDRWSQWRLVTSNRNGVTSRLTLPAAAQSLTVQSLRRCRCAAN